MNDPRTDSEYTSRINRTLDYIEANLEKPMTLDELASIASFSRFHFTRIFHSVAGESPFRFILRLRLEKAAAFILSDKNESISEIAFRCGFSDISIFSRSFRNHFKISASQYRKNGPVNSKISQQKSNPSQVNGSSDFYFCPDLQTIKWRTNMKLNKSVEVRDLPAMTVAYIRRIGPYNGDQQMFQTLRNKLFAWADTNGIFGKGDFRFLVMYHDDPNISTGDNLRMSLCLAIPPETKVSGEIGKMEIESARYAIARFELTGPEFTQAWDWLYAVWLPSSGYLPDDKPCFEMYTESPKDGNYIIDICIPVKHK